MYCTKEGGGGAAARTAAASKSPFPGLRLRRTPIKTIYRRRCLWTAPYVLHEGRAVAARLHERRRLRNLRFLGCGSGGFLSKYSIAYYKLRPVCMYYVCMCLKYGSLKKISFCCRCSTFLSPTFVEIKNSFTRTLNF